MSIEDQAVNTICGLIRKGIQVLIETKQLYGSGLKELKKEWRGPYWGRIEAIFTQAFDEYDWELYPEIPKDPPPTAEFVMHIPHVKVYCVHCDSVEVHNRGVSWPPHVIGPAVQLFGFPFECQRCRNEPIFYLVKRDHHMLRLVGRSEFHQIDVPKVIRGPGSPDKHYRDAAIAFASGRTLAALFFLRTLVEQYMREVTGVKGQIRGDELASLYRKHLDLNFLKKSLIVVYSELSVKLHAADADAGQYASLWRQ